MIGNGCSLACVMLSERCPPWLCETPANAWAQLWPEDRMLQLALYKYICESEYGLRIDSLFLGVVHPTQDKPRLIRMPYLREEIEAIVEDQVLRGLAVSSAVPGAAAPFRLPTVLDGHA